MKYFVILGDGRRFGPADVPTLNQWISEKRLTHESMLEEETSGQQQKATAVKGLVFPDVAPQSVMQPRPDAPALNPFDPLSSSQEPITQRPEFAQANPPKSSPFASAPQAVTSYPRAGQVAYAGTGVPLELQGGFNFGAFMFSWIWGLNHKVYWMLVALILGVLRAVADGIELGLVALVINIASLGFSVYCGLVGNRLAWTSGRFSTPQECLDCQRTWRNWGIGCLGIILLIVLLAVILPLIMLSQRN